jgi:single-strand DNA-binding protein
MAGSINRVILIGNLTRDPETRQAGSTTVCTLRLAVNDRVKDQSSGEWGDRPNYFDVDVFGSQGELCGKYLAKGRQVAVEGKLRWREWEAQDGQKRSAVSVVADNVQFIGPREGGASQGGAPRESGGARFAKSTDVAEADFAGDDDIPF